MADLPTALDYLHDTYLFEYHSAVLLACDELVDGKPKAAPSATHRLIFDRTLFHPQGGGQPSDRGQCFVGDDDVFEVLFVIATPNKVIEHYGTFPSSSSSSSFSIHTQVRQVVDQELRRLHSKLHSAGHVIDAALARCEGDLLTRLKAIKGYHFPDGPNVEYEVVGSAALSEQEMKDLPTTLNRILKDICDGNLPTIVSTLAKNDAAAELQLNPSDLVHYPESVRVVKVAELPCACGGTHVNSTSELGTVTITKIKKKKNIVKISYELS